MDHSNLALNGNKSGDSVLSVWLQVSIAAWTLERAKQYYPTLIKNSTYIHLF